jgi:hypothetical protein
VIEDHLCAEADAEDRFSFPYPFPQMNVQAALTEILHRSARCADAGEDDAACVIQYAGVVCDNARLVQKIQRPGHARQVSPGSRPRRSFSYSAIEMPSILLLNKNLSVHGDNIKPTMGSSFHGFAISLIATERNTSSSQFFPMPYRYPARIARLQFTVDRIENGELVRPFRSEEDLAVTGGEPLTPPGGRISRCRIPSRRIL